MPSAAEKAIAAALTPEERIALVVGARFNGNLEAMRRFWPGPDRPMVSRVEVWFRSAREKVAAVRCAPEPQRRHGPRPPEPEPWQPPPEPRRVLPPLPTEPPHPAVRILQPGTPSPVTLLPSAVTCTREPEEAVMTPLPEDIEAPVGGFVERVQEEARKEAYRVLGELDKLRFEAQQVDQVLRALGLPTPAQLTALLGGEPAQLPQIAREEAAPPAVAPASEAPEVPPAPEEPKAEDRPDASAKKTVPHLSPTDFPEHLREMPAAQGTGGGALTQRIAAAERQLLVFQAVNAKPTIIPSEVMDVMPEGMRVDRISDDLRQLGEAGLIRRTGKNRHRHDRPPGMPGRASVEYAPASSADAEDPASLVTLRDWVVKQKQFAVAEAIEATGLTEDVVRSGLSALIGRGVVEYVGLDDLELYEYVPPSGPGKAAELDAKKRRAASAQASTNGSGGTGPVAGVGGSGRYTSHKEMNDLLKAAAKAGGEITKTGDGHISVKNPLTGQRCGLSSTPGASGVTKSKKKLEGIGLKV
jgi:hypothetical protein